MPVEHKPAGSPDGGQFTSDGGSAGGGDKFAAAKAREQKQRQALAKFGQAKAKAPEQAPTERPKLEVKEADPKDFHAAFSKAFEGSEFENHVTHYTEDQLKGMKLYTTPDGNAGVAVHDHGDGRIEATALFNNGGPKGAGLGLLNHAIENAKVNYVECYGPRLSKMYSGLGFKDSSSSKFDKSQAAASWNFRRFDSPNYHTMKLAA